MYITKLTLLRYLLIFIFTFIIWILLLLIVIVKIIIYYIIFLIFKIINKIIDNNKIIGLIYLIKNFIILTSTEIWKIIKFIILNFYINTTSFIKNIIFSVFLIIKNIKKLNKFIISKFIYFKNISWKLDKTTKKLLNKMYEKPGFFKPFIIIIRDRRKNIIDINIDLRPSNTYQRIKYYLYELIYFLAIFLSIIFLILYYFLIWLFLVSILLVIFNIIIVILTILIKVLLYIYINLYIIFYFITKKLMFNYSFLNFFFNLMRFWLKITWISLQFVAIFILYSVNILVIRLLKVIVFYVWFKFYFSTSLILKWKKIIFYKILLLKIIKKIFLKLFKKYYFKKISFKYIYVYIKGTVWLILTITWIIFFII